MLGRDSYRTLKRNFEDHPEETVAELSAAILDRKIKPEEFSIRSLAEALIPDGEEFVRSLDPRHAMNFREASMVNTSVLGIISGNIIYSAMMEGYEAPEYVVSRMVDTQTGRPGEIRPRFTPFGDDATTIPEGEEYPNVVIGTDWTTMPQPVKEGGIIPVTREAVWEDRTGQLLSIARDCGNGIWLRKELRLIDTLIGYTKNAGGYGEFYKWKGTDYAPFQLSTPWINSVASNELVDWTDMEAVENLFTNMREPTTGLPITIGGKTVLTTPQKRFAAARVFGGTELTYATPGGTDVSNFTKGPNPLQGYNPQSSALLYDRLVRGGNAGLPLAAANAANVYFVGDFQRALSWFEVFAVKFEQQGMESEAAFRRDVVAQFKFSMKGTGMWDDPRYMVRSYTTLA